MTTKHIHSRIGGIMVRPNKKICVLTVTCPKNLVGRSALIFFFLLSTKPEIVVPGSGIRYFIFDISGKPSFVEAVFKTSYAVFLPSLLSISTKS